MGWLRKKETEDNEEGVGKMNVIISEEVRERIAQRGIKPEEVKLVIEAAEASNRKLATKDEKRYLAKKKIGEMTVYADYCLSGNNATLNSAYAHRLKLGKVVNATNEAGWTCKDCGSNAMEGHIEMSYMQVSRIGPAVICPNCNDAWAEEYLAINTLAAVEGLFEKKRA